MTELPLPPKVSKRRKSKRSKPLQDRPKGVWYPDLVGVIPTYPHTLEAFERKQAWGKELAKIGRANGVPTRQGVPDGWAGRKPEIAAHRATARIQADKMVELMIEKELFDAANVEAKEALKAAVAIYQSPCETTRERIQALKIVLEFTQAKPASSSKVQLSSAEDFLAALAVEAGVNK